MPFAAIYVPDFPVEALMRAQPELRECALAVVEGTPPLLSVVAVNEKGRQCGVQAGMTALQAEERLGAAGSTPQIRLRSLVQEQSAHAALLDCACAFSPRVEDTAADTVLLDVAGLERLFGPAAKLAREIAQRVSEIGMEANVAVAANPDAAMHAARGFSGVTVIPEGEEAGRVGELPVYVLAPAEEILETLDRWGVRNLRALAALPKTAASQRLGQEGLRLQKLARGQGSRPLVVAEPPLNFEEAVELEYPVALLEPLAFLLNRMLEQLCARLGARALAAQELRLKLELEKLTIDDCRFQIEKPPAESLGAARNRQSSIVNLQSSASPRLCGDFRETRNPKRETTFFRTIKLPVPMLDAKVFLKLLQLDLQAHPPSAPVLKIWLEGKPAEPRRAQSGLFVPVTPEPEKLELTLARLKAVVGRRSPVVGKNRTEELRVGSAEVVDTHRPDMFRMQCFDPFSVAGRQSPVASEGVPSAGLKSATSVVAPIANHHPHPIVPKAGTTRVGHPRQSPTASLAMRVLRPPLGVAVDLKNGVPRRVRPNCSRPDDFAHIAGEVVWAAGPWRVSGDWWTEESWSREEWDIALQNDAGMALYRIYRDCAREKWFVQAEYD